MNRVFIKVAQNACGWAASCLAAGCLLNGQRVSAAEVQSTSQPDKYYFDKTMSREVLENHANTPSPAVPDGLGDEEAIRRIWAADSAKSGDSAPTSSSR